MRPWGDERGREKRQGRNTYGKTVVRLAAPTDAPGHADLPRLRLFGLRL